MVQTKVTPTQMLVRGIGVGFVATQVLDLVSIYLYENLKAEDRLHEDRVRGGHQAYEVMVDKIARNSDRRLSEPQIKYWGWKFHRLFGLFGGVQYMLLRRFFPKVSKGMGLNYGVGFFLLADQFLIYLVGATPGPAKFSWKTHLRGAVAHIAYGVAAELTARSFDRISSYENGTGMAKAEDLVRGTRGYRESAAPQAFA